PRLRGPVPQAEDIVATATRKLTDIDMTDERSVIATVRDAVAELTESAGVDPCRDFLNRESLASDFAIRREGHGMYHTAVRA
ncbi:hypothetical protein C6A85_12040, partial [Mycobacterium sp. ITM-2017-0098]